MVKVEEFVEIEPGTEIQPSEQASSLKELSAEEKLALDATQWDQEVDDMYITKFQNPRALLRKWISQIFQIRRLSQIKYKRNQRARMFQLARHSIDGINQITIH